MADPNTTPALNVEFSQTESVKIPEFDGQSFPVPDENHILVIHRKLEINADRNGQLYHHSLILKTNTKVVNAYKAKLERLEQKIGYPLVVKMYTKDDFAQAKAKARTRND